MGVMSTAQKSGYDAHVADTANPHGVTAAQVGAPSTATFNAHAARHKSGGADEIKLHELGAPTGSVPFNGQVAQNIGAAILATDAQQLGQSPVVRVKAAFTAGLPAYTVNNGTAGVGATITLNANAALPSADGQTVAVDDLVFLNTGASFADSGVWKVTALGDNSTTPGVLTRSDRADTPTKLAGLIVFVETGIKEKGSAFALPLTPSAITINTTLLVFRQLGPLSSWRGFAAKEDFNYSSNAFTLSATLPYGQLGLLSSVSGAAATNVVTGASNDGKINGILTEATGTATTGLSQAYCSGLAFQLNDLNSDFFFAYKVQVPTDSNGTDTFASYVGPSGGLTTDGVMVKADKNTNASFQFITRAASVSTTTTGSLAIPAAGTWYWAYLWKTAGSAVWHAAVEVLGSTAGAIELGTGQSTNIPSVQGSILCGVLKSAGINPRTHVIDTIEVRWEAPLGR